MTEDDIVHENGNYWVGRNRKDYSVYENTSTHAVLWKAFHKNDDGKSLAIKYCDYKAKVAELANRIGEDHEL